jgi:hypothetical protein
MLGTRSLSTGWNTKMLRIPNHNSTTSLKTRKLNPNQDLQDLRNGINSKYYNRYKT